MSVPGLDPFINGGEQEITGKTHLTHFRCLHENAVAGALEGFEGRPMFRGSLDL